VAHPPTRRGHSLFWYTLEVVEGPYPPGSRLRGACAGRRLNPDGDATAVDPDEERVALAKLMTWARDNGWSIVE
jgi:hypothetical protein